MAAAAEVQALLRFLTKDARIPLADAMPKIGALRKEQLNTPEKIAKATDSDLKSIFADEKVLKQVINAAKRVSNPKKRTLPRSDPVSKRVKTDINADDDEASLALPQTDVSVPELEQLVVETNRAPLFLAFTIAVLAHTHAEQPLSSRWSLAQAVVSAGAQSKAKYLGLTTGPTAEEDGWAQGQPKIKVMGREIAVMRRQVAIQGEGDETTASNAFWGLDLEALRKSNGPLIGGKDKSSSGPPIHKPASARTYLLKSMLPVDSGSTMSDSTSENKQRPTKKKSAQELVKMREDAAAVVLKAIDEVCKSWASVLTAEQLDARAQAWYTRTRPDVEQGQAGWGQKGQVRIADILSLRKE